MVTKKRGIDCIIRNSKAQISIFMITAIVILIAGMLYLFFQRQSTEKEIDFVNPEIAPVKLYVEDCLKSVLEDGLYIIGLTGGYTDVPPIIGNNPRSYLTTYPGKGFKIPYWWYEGIDATPSEGYIKQQLLNYVATELKNCINNFESFAGRYEINKLSEPIINVQFNENDVSAGLDYRLEVVSKQGTLKVLIEKFSSTVPIRFKKVYELARLIMERENKDYFIERKTIDLYSMDIDIPTTDVAAGCKTKVWQLSKIRDKLQTLLRVNLPYIRIKGTAYNEDLYVPDPDGSQSYKDSYFQNHYIWEIDNDAEKKFRNMKVSFAYENWSMDIYARPIENGLLKSNTQKGTEILSFFCIHLWHFTYDVSYPVLVTVLDQETDLNKPYRFNFPFKVSVDHNEPDRAIFGTTLFDSLDEVSSEEYCNELQNEITLFTVDNSTGEDINDVNLTFVCGRFYCEIGKSDWLSFGATSGLTVRLPYCVYGIVKGKKGGYAEAKEFIQTDLDGRSYVLFMNPVKEFQDYKVVKHLLSNPSSSEDIKENEKATILIKGTDTGFEGFSVVPKQVEFPLQIPIKDGTYEVSIYLTDDENVLGGYIGNWSVSKNDVTNANEVIFHVVEQGPASDDEKALFISSLSSYSKNVPKPELR